MGIALCDCQVVKHHLTPLRVMSCMDHGDDYLGVMMDWRTCIIVKMVHTLLLVIVDVET